MLTATADAEPERDGGGGDLMSLAEDLNTGGVIAGIESRFAEEDGRRGAYLDLLVKRGGTCRGCGSLVNDAMLEEHPGVCGACFRMKKLRPDPALLSELAALSLSPPAPAPKPAEPEAPKETTMPCKSCGKEGHNARTCSGLEPKKAAEKAPAKAKAPPAAPAPKPARGPRIELRVETVDELLDRRAQLLGELDQVDARIRAALVAKEDELAKLRAAVEAAKQRAESQAEAA